MGLDHSNHHVLAAGVPPDRLIQHGVGFAHARSVSKKKLELTAFLCWGTFSSHWSGVLGIASIVVEGRKGFKEGQRLEVRLQRLNPNPIGTFGDAKILPLQSDPLTSGPSFVIQSPRECSHQIRVWIRDRGAFYRGHHLRRLSLAPSKSTTIALAFLLGVLGISASWGLRQAVLYVGDRDPVF